MATKQVTIDVNTLNKDVTYKATTTYTSLYLKNLTNLADLTFTGSDVGNNLTLTVNGYNIILKDYFAKNGTYPIKTIKTDSTETPNVNILKHVNALYINGAKQNMAGGVAKSITGTVFDDFIVAGSVKQSINAGKGNDKIYAGSGNTTITGGAGTNTIVYSYDDAEDKFGKDTIVLTKGETLNLNIVDEDTKPAALTYSKSGNNLVIKNDQVDTDKITIKDYYGKTTGATVYINGVNPEKEALINFNKSNISNAKITGSALADYIDVTTAEQQIVKKKPVNLTINAGAGDDVIMGSAFKDTIKGGAGDDLIRGSAGKDTIVGGTGHNTIKYTNIDQLGDKITLTKNEKLDIDISSIEATGIAYRKDGKNLVIDITKGSNTKSVTLTNFAGSDITTKNGEVNLKVSNAQTINLRTDLYIKGDNKIVATKNVTGSWLAEEIDASTSAKKLTLNAGGGSDVIIGSNYNDTIKGGSGADTITAGKGNDIIYGDTGKNTLVFAAGDGKDTVYSGKGTDTLKFEGIAVDDVKFKKSGTSLIVKYNHTLVDEKLVAQDSITIKDYYNKKGKAASSVKFINIGGKNYDLETFKGYADSGRIIIAQDATAYGTDGDDIIFAAGGNSQTVKAGDGNDVIYATSTSKNSMLWGEKGNDTLYASDDFVSIHLLGGGGDDILYGSNYNGADVETGQCKLSPNGGKNIIYAGEYCSKDIYFDYVGENTLYTSSGENNAAGHNALNRVFLTDHGKPYSSSQRNTIYWQGTDRLQIETPQTKSENLYMTKEDDDLVILYGRDNELTLKDYYKAGNEGMANIFFQTSDYGSITLSSLIEHNGGLITKTSDVVGTDNREYIVGTDEDQMIRGNGGDDIIRPMGGNDIIYLGAGNDHMFAGDGNKTVYAESGNNTIYLGKGTNTVHAGIGEDSIWTTPDSQNTVVNFAADDAGDDKYRVYSTGTLVFKGDTLDDLTMDFSAKQSSGSDIFITRSSGKKVEIMGNSLAKANEYLTIEDKNGNITTIRDLNTIVGDADYGSGQWLTTGAGDDILSIGKANDSINPGTGTNTIKLRTPVTSGNVNTYTYENGTDTIELPDGTTDLSSVILFKQNKDLIIGYNNDTSNNTLKLKNYFDTPEIGANITLKAGAVTRTLKNYIDAGDYSEVISCTPDNHTIDQSASTKAVTVNGCTSADIITGSAFADTITGKGGGDTLNGGAGNDTYIFSANAYGNGQDVINDAFGDNDKLSVYTKLHNDSETCLYFEVMQTGNVVNGRTEYTTGNDLYLVKDKDYTFENATTSNGIKIVNYFTTGKIEQIRNDFQDTEDLVPPQVISAIGQTVANWLRQNGFASTSDAVATATDEQKAELLKLYKPLISTYGYKDAANGDDFILNVGKLNQSVSGNNGNDIIFASDEWVEAYIRGNDGDDILYGSNFDGTGQCTIETGAGNDTVYAGDNCAKYIKLGSGNDTVYTSSNAYNMIWVDEYAAGANGGHDTINWLGTTSLTMRFFNYSGNELAFTRTGASDDLVARYGDDNTVTMKDYFKAGSESLSSTYISWMNNRGGQSIGIATGVDMGYQGGVMDYTETTLGSYDGNNSPNYIVAEETCGGVNAGGGSDVVVAKGYSSIFTNKNIANGKDTTPNVYDQVKLVGGAYHYVYAQSPVNIITSTVEGGSSDNYYAYIDQTTYINDNGGNDDWLIFQNTQDTTDGAKANLKVLFDVNSDFTYDGTEAGRRLVGDVYITSDASKANFNYFKDRMMYNFEGVCIKDNNIDQIQSSDSYGLTSDDIATLAQDVAGWLSNNGYADVSAVFNSNNTTDIAALVAKFDTANWVDLSDM
ncbi:MAG: hypothetical protein K6A44_00765 [bacterium]|nr:hypothetical protein [bacterium]